MSEINTNHKKQIMNKLLFSSLILLLTISVNAQSKKTKDQNAIKEMCGCFEVTFNFAETFNYSKDSTYKASKTKVDKGLEWAGLVEDKNNKFLFSIYYKLVFLQIQ